VDGRPEDLSEQSLVAFWTWWGSAKDRIAAAIDSQSLSEAVVDEITNAVHALNAGFAWELGPGRASRHAFTITPEGNLSLRRLTARWLSSAPPADPTWEYYGSRQADPRLGLEIHGHRFSPEEFKVAYRFDESRERFDLELHHPRFKGLQEEIVMQVAYLTLDETLGEDDVERWMGELRTVPSKSPGSSSLEEFLKAVETARKRVTGEQFTLGQGQSRDGHPVVLMVNSALKQIDNLEHVHHLVVVIALRDPSPNGLPSNSESEPLNSAEDDLLASLGVNAIQIGRVTWAGRREIHFFVGDPGAAESRVAAWTERLTPWSATHMLTYDPGWAAAKEGIYAALAPRGEG
jgi:hypothetical protein